MKYFQFLIFITLAACGLGDPKGPLTFSHPIDEAVRAEEVSFKVLQKRVLSKCVGCHGKWTSEDSISGMITPGDPENSQFFDSVKTGRMPKNSPPLTNAQLEIVRDYIKNIRVTSPDSSPIPEEKPPVSFTELHEKVFQVSCLPCHSKVLNDEEALKSRWIDPKKIHLSKILVETESGRMPKDRSPLTEEQLQVLRNYVFRFRTE